MDAHPGMMRDVAMMRQREEGLHRVAWGVACLYVVRYEPALAAPLCWLALAQQVLQRWTNLHFDGSGAGAGVGSGKTKKSGGHAPQAPGQVRHYPLIALPLVGVLASLFNGR